MPRLGLAQRDVLHRPERRHDVLELIVIYDLVQGAAGSDDGRGAVAGVVDVRLVH